MDYEISCTGGTLANKRRLRRMRENSSVDGKETSALAHAVEDNDVRKVEDLLEGGVDLGVCDSGANTVLHTAARLGHSHICVLLAKHGAEINTQNKAGFTPLFLASRVNLQTVCVLLDFGAEARICNHLGEIPLHAASSSGLNDVIVTLVSCGSDVNTRSAQGVTPLHCAVVSGSREAVKTLLRLGAEVNSTETAQRSKNNTHSSISLTENCPCPLKEASDLENSDNLSDQDVRVRVPKQAWFLSSGRLGSDAQLGFQSHPPDSSGIYGSGPNQGHSSGRFLQCGCCLKDTLCRDERSDGVGNSRKCSVKASLGSILHSSRSSYLPSQVPSTSPHPSAQRSVRELPGLDRFEASSAVSSVGQTVFKAFDHETEHSFGEEMAVIPEPVLSITESSYDELTLASNVHGSLLHVADTSHSHPQWSACSHQMCRRKRQILHPQRKTLSCPPTSGRSSTSQSASLSEEKPTPLFSLPQKKEFSDKILRQTQVRLRNQPPEVATNSSSPQCLQDVTPLHRASQLAMETVAQLLLEAGANVNARTSRGETPLHWAALYSATTGRGEITPLLRLLLKAGAEIEAVTSPNACTPLHLAALAGDALCTSLLISAGADLHKQDHQGNTPLHKACERIVSPEANRVRTVRLLLTNGASAQAVNNEGLTPLNVLLMHRSDDVDHDIVRVLLNHGSDPNLSPPSGEPPLLTALSNGMYGFAKVLVEKGADPNVLAEDGRTPLHYVCKEAQPQLFKTVWSKGGNPAAVDSRGFTPLRYAIESRDEATVEACICSGAGSWQRNSINVPASSLREMFDNPANFASVFQYAFATAQLSFLVKLHLSGGFSFAELHSLKKLCELDSLHGLNTDQREVVGFVLRISQAPVSLQTLSRWTISHAIGCSGDRKWRARQLSLPSLLQESVLFF